MQDKKAQENYIISMRDYKGMYCVEFNSKSLGATLFVSWDKEQAEAECARFSQMSKDEMISFLRKTRRYDD